MEEISSNKRIAKNTIMLYIRMLVTMAIGLFTSRIILQTLGISDFGLYGVVGGIVAMFGFLNSTMSGATSRFLSFGIGKGDVKSLKVTFSSALILHIAIAFLVTLICETFGMWFLENKLVIPEGRLSAARWVFHFSVLSALFQVIQVPFNGAIISHERMGVYAYVEIMNALLRLLIIYLLVVWNFDKLILFSILNFIVSVLIFTFYIYYSLKSFTECSFSLIWKKEVVHEMLTYTGWQFFSNLSLMAITQGVNLLMNLFFGTFMNAAYDIATRVKGIVMNLSTNFTMATRPQIVISYSANEFTRTYSLMCNAMKITFILMLLICAPLMIETQFVLRIWLGVVPDFTVTLVRLSLMWNLMVALTTGYGDVANATGDVKMPSFISGFFYLAIFPITYFAFKSGAPFWFPFVLNAIAVMFAPFYTCYPIKKHLPGFSWWTHVFSELLFCYGIMVVVLAVSYSMTLFVQESFLRFIIIGFLSAAMTCTLGYYILFPVEIRAKLVMLIRNKLNSISDVFDFVK